MTSQRAIALNVLALYALAALLAAAFAAQFILGELPCPLCLLQRIMFALLAIGPILNIRFGPRPSHYALSLLAAVVGATVSTRQVLLHIMPGDPGFGTALFGYHYYTWALIGFIAAIVAVVAGAAVRPAIREAPRCSLGAQRHRACCRLARDRPDGCERRLDLARMRLQGLRG
jgi:disulfide bond formation protein DsbB